MEDRRKDGLRAWYKVEYGSYYYVQGTRKSFLNESGETIILMTDQVAFLFDRETGAIYKHGSVDTVEKAWSKFRTSRATGLVANMQKVVFPRGFDPEELNRCLSTSGYILRLLEKNGALVGEPLLEEN
jgi:hypothetical protein